MAEASYTKRDFGSFRSHASRSGILLPSATVTFWTAVSRWSVRGWQFPRSLLVSTSARLDHLQGDACSAFLDNSWTVLVPTLWTDRCCDHSVLRRTGIVVLDFHCKLSEWCWKTPLASENMLTGSHVAYKIPLAFRSSWQASFRLGYCCITFPRTSRAEIFDKKTEAQHQGLPCSWIFHVFVWKMLGSKTLSLSLL